MVTLTERISEGLRRSATPRGYPPSTLCLGNEILGRLDEFARQYTGNNRSAAARVCLTWFLDMVDRESVS